MLPSLLIRTSKATVPADALPLDVRLCHEVFTPASNTRDVNEPETEYGVRRVQSTTTVPLRPRYSLAAITRIGPATAGCTTFTA